MTNESDGRVLLKQGDFLAEQGDVAGAAEAYLRYSERVERDPPEVSNPSGSLRAAAVRRQVLEMFPERRDIRRKLVESYANLGLLDEARNELRRLATEWESEGETTARDEVLARLAVLG